MIEYEIVCKYFRRLYFVDNMLEARYDMWIFWILYADNINDINQDSPCSLQIV